MGYRPLAIRVISAQDLKDVKHGTNKDVYAVGLISGYPQTMQKTTVDRDGGTNPTWNFLMNFTIDESAAQQNPLNLWFLVCCGDRAIGEVQVPVKELLDTVGDNNSPIQFVGYQLTEGPSGKPKGVLNFSYEFGEKFNVATVAAAAAVIPQMAMCTVPVMGPSSSYPQPRLATWPYPSPPTGGYPPSAAGYGDPPPPPPYALHLHPLQPPMGANIGYQPPPGTGYWNPGPPVQEPDRWPGIGLGDGPQGWLGRVLAGALISDVISEVTGHGAGLGTFMSFP